MGGRDGDAAGYRADNPVGLVIDFLRQHLKLSFNADHLGIGVTITRPENPLSAASGSLASSLPAINWESTTSRSHRRFFRCEKLLDARKFRLRFGLNPLCRYKLGCQVAEPLIRQCCAAGGIDDAVLHLVDLHRRIRRTGLPAQLAHPGLKSFPGFFRCARHFSSAFADPAPT